MSRYIKAIVALLFGATFFLSWPHEVLALPGTKTIAVRIFVDEEEPRRDEFWKETLGRRLDRASTILGGYGSIRFSVTKFGFWDSDDGIHDFPSSLKEFEAETDPRPAELAIGFTSQYRLKRGISNLGGTRGPMRRHVLIREGSPNVQEIERLEVLVHELAHYLGAAHSGRSDSVMRPLLGDGQSRAKAFRIQLDPANATIVRFVSAEMAGRNVTNMHQLTLQTKVAIRTEYARLAKDFPQDEVATRYVLMMDKSIRYSVAARQRKIEAQRKARAAVGSPKPAGSLKPGTQPSSSPVESSPTKSTPVKAAPVKAAPVKPHGS